MKRMVLLSLCPLAALAACQTAYDQPPEPAPPAPPLTASEVMPPRAELEGARDAHGFVEAACGGCHSVEAYGVSPNPNSPTFADIANREGLTQETLTAWLRDAHNYPEVMDFDLEKPQVEEIAAYILSLRSKDYHPPI